ncbi:oligosaccharide flippase family protein, partial [Reinekea blandensis]
LFGTSGLLMSTYYVHYLFMVWITKNSEIIPTNNGQSLSSIFRVVSKYRSFILYRAPQAFLNASSQGLPVIMLSMYFGLESAAFYALGRAVLALPINIVGQAIADVYYGITAKKVREGVGIYSSLLKLTLGLLIVSIGPFFILYLYAPLIFSLVFGEQWELAGVYSQQLSFWYLMGLINKPSVSAISLLKINQFYLIFELISTVVRVLAIALGYYFTKSDVSTVLIYSFVGVFLNVFLIIFVLQKVKNRYG